MLDARNDRPLDDPGDDLLDSPSASPDDIGDTTGIGTGDQLDEDLVAGEQIADTPGEVGRSGA